MKNLVLYDSQYGNTKQIARIISSSLTSCKLLDVNQAIPHDLQKINLLVVGSPTQGGQPTKALQQFLCSLKPDALVHTKVAAFDTRFNQQDLNFALKLLIKTLGYAAPKIARILQSKGGKLIAPPQGFFVMDTSGPIAAGESEKAIGWLKL